MEQNDSNHFMLYFLLLKDKEYAVISLTLHHFCIMKYNDIIN